MDKKHWRDKRKLPTVSDNDHFQKQAEIALIREQCAADIMWEYVDHQHRINVSQIWFKSLFFGIVCVVFGAVVWFSLATVWKIAQKSEIAIADVGVAVTSMVSLISAVIVLIAAISVLSSTAISVPRGRIKSSISLQGGLITTGPMR